MFKKIIVPVDGSQSSWRALEEAMVVGKKFESELVVMTVTQPYNNAALLAVPLDHNVLDKTNATLQEVGTGVLNAAEDKTKEAAYPFKTSFRLEVGHPSERILEVCKSQEADAIVLGSRGLSGIAEFFLGSVSSKIAQYAKVPVLIIK